VPEVRYAIWGSAGHAKVLASLIRAIGGRVVATFDNDPAAQALRGVPLHLGEAGFAKWADAAPDLAAIRGLVAIGGQRGADRLALQALLASRGLRIEPLVHPDASVCESARLGPGSQVLAPRASSTTRRASTTNARSATASTSHPEQRYAGSCASAHG